MLCTTSPMKESSSIGWCDNSQMSRFTHASPSMAIVFDRRSAIQAKRDFWSLAKFRAVSVCLERERNNRLMPLRLDIWPMRFALASVLRHISPAS